MKVLGLFIIFTAASLFGIYYAQKQLDVLRSIKRTEELISKIILCIKNEHATINDIFEFIKKDCDTITEKFIGSISVNKLYDAENTAKKCGFSNDTFVLNIVYDVFNIFGKYSAEDQTKEMEYCRQKLRDHYIKNESDIKVKAKLAASSGFLGGILAVILFL